MNFKTELDNTVRILTFQSKHVLSEIISGNIYTASELLRRISGNYTLDCQQLKVKHPIFGFLVTRENISNDDQHLDEMIEDFKKGLMTDDEGLENMYCLELFVPLDLVKKELTNPCSQNSVVIPYIEKKFLHRVYLVKSIQNSPIKQKYITKSLQYRKSQVPTFSCKPKVTTYAVSSEEVCHLDNILS